MQLQYITMMGFVVSNLVTTCFLFFPNISAPLLFSIILVTGILSSISVVTFIATLYHIASIQLEYFRESMLANDTSSDKDLSYTQTSLSLNSFESESVSD